MECMKIRTCIEELKQVRAEAAKPLGKDVEEELVLPGLKTKKEAKS